MRHDTPAYIKAWPGYVMLPDALNFPQLNIWQDALDEIAEGRAGLTWDVATSDPRTSQPIVKALCQIVQEWHLDKLPERVSLEQFPATPRVQSTLLLGWLVTRIALLFDGAEDTPEKKVE